MILWNGGRTEEVTGGTKTPAKEVSYEERGVDKVRTDEIYELREQGSISTLCGALSGREYVE